MARSRKSPNRLRELREAGVKLSQEQTGKLLGCDGASVSRHENGQPLSRQQILAYAELYGVPTHEIFLVAGEGEQG